MQKNVASQKWIVFAFDLTDNTPKTGDSAQITADGKFVPCVETNNNGLITSNTSIINDNNWHHLKMSWSGLLSAGGSFICYVDGLLETTTGSLTNGGTATGWDYIYFGGDRSGASNADILIDQVYITSDPNTPQIPTANGLPLDAPIVRND